MSVTTINRKNYLKPLSKQQYKIASGQQCIAIINTHASIINGALKSFTISIYHINWMTDKL